MGFFDVSELNEFRLNGGRLTGYPKRPEIGIEYSGGSLGMVISVGVGQTLALLEKYGSAGETTADSSGDVGETRSDDVPVPQVFVLVGDADQDKPRYVK